MTLAEIVRYMELAGKAFATAGHIAGRLLRDGGEVTEAELEALKATQEDAEADWAEELRKLREAEGE